MYLLRQIDDIIRQHYGNFVATSWHLSATLWQLHGTFRQLCGNFMAPFVNITATLWHLSSTLWQHIGTFRQQYGNIMATFGNITATLWQLFGNAGWCQVSAGLLLSRRLVPCYCQVSRRLEPG